MVRVYADLHIHSRYSAATSLRMGVPEITQGALLKGLQVLGTGDALHPGWLRELRQSLEEDAGTGLYRPKMPNGEGVRFVVQTEVGTVFEVEGRTRHVHHVVLMPSLDAAEQLSEGLSRRGNMEADGRPVLSMRPAELLEIVLETDRESLVYPAHAWTPWRSLFGSINGVDSMEQCYEDQTSRIHALETGMSSDPPMNWRVSALDRYALVSASDAHSPWPFRIGREACVFELPRLTYRGLKEAITRKDPSRFPMTIEVDPAYGKYHWSGHRNCGVGPLSHKEAMDFGYKCPVCRRALTKGVESRVEELADRPYGFKPPGAIGYMSLLPLHEILALSVGVHGESEQRLYSSAVQSQYDRMIRSIGSEFKALVEASYEELAKVVSRRIAEAILSLREGSIKVVPGYDGVYGRPVLGLEGEEDQGPKRGTRGSLEGFLR